jgi:hypothetical protein
MSSDHPRDLNLNRLRPPNPQAEQFEQPERRQLTPCGETVGGASCGGELSPGGRSSEMIGDGCSHAFVKNAAGSSSHDVTDTASCESLRLQLVELGLGDRSRVEELFGRRDLIGARAATARGDD